MDCWVFGSTISIHSAWSFIEKTPGRTDHKQHMRETRKLVEHSGSSLIYRTNTSHDKVINSEINAIKVIGFGSGLAHLADASEAAHYGQVEKGDRESSHITAPNQTWHTLHCCSIAPLTIHALWCGAPNYVCCFRVNWRMHAVRCFWKRMPLSRNIYFMTHVFINKHPLKRQCTTKWNKNLFLISGEGSRRLHWKRGSLRWIGWQWRWCRLGSSEQLPVVTAESRLDVHIASQCLHSCLLMHFEWHEWRCCRPVASWLRQFSSSPNQSISKMGHFE